MHNYGTLYLESKDLVDKAEVKYNELKDRIRLKGN